MSFVNYITSTLSTSAFALWLQISQHCPFSSLWGLAAYFYFMSCLQNTNCMNGGFKAAICPHSKGNGKWIHPRKSTVCRWFEPVQWLGALICHFVPSTVLLSTDNGVPFLLPFTPRDKWPLLRQRLLFVPISDWSLFSCFPLEGEKTWKTKTFFPLCISSWGTFFFFSFWFLLGVFFTWRHGRLFTNANMLETFSLWQSPLECRADTSVLQPKPNSPEDILSHRLTDNYAVSHSLSESRPITHPYDPFAPYRNTHFLSSSLRRTAISCHMAKTFDLTASPL